MIKVGEMLATLDWLDQVHWCNCVPKQDRCEVCRLKRQQERLRQQARPTVFRGEAPRKTRRLDWEP